MHRIYKITNLITNSFYIGYTSRTLAERLYEHDKASRRTNNNQLITRAIAKYGVENFSIEQLATAETEAEALLLEIEFICQLRANRNDFPDGNGYNLHDGGNRPPLQKGKTWKRGAVARRPKLRGKKREYTPEGLARHSSQATRGKTFEDAYGKEKADEIRVKLLQRMHDRRTTRADRPKIAKSNQNSRGEITIVYSNGETVTVGSGTEAADLLNCSVATISRVVNNKARPPYNIISITR